MLKMFVKDCLPWVGPHIGAEEEYQEEGEAEISIPLCHFEIEELRMKLRLSSRDSGGKIHLVLFLFLPTLLLAVK